MPSVLSTGAIPRSIERTDARANARKQSDQTRTTEVHSIDAHFKAKKVATMQKAFASVNLP